ncbi:MAG: hypothetical protein RR370_01905 [Synergistaceae bacterium]
METVNRPLLKPIKAFDATIGGLFEFTWSSTYSVEGYKINFYNRENVSAPIGTYTQKNHMGFKINLTAQQLSLAKIDLKNHKSYYAIITILYKSGGVTKETPESNRVLFRCEKSPVFYIASPTAKAVVESSSFPVEIRYAQQDGVMLDEYAIRIYQNSVEVFNSGTLYGKDLVFHNSPDCPYFVDISYIMDKLSDMTSYELEVECSLASDSVISNGMTVFANSKDDPNVKRISFDVEIPKTYYEYANLGVVNDPYHGCIKISSDVKVVSGIGYKYDNVNKNITYIKNDFVDLTENGTDIRYTEGFDFKGNFILFFNGYKFKPNTTVLQLKTEKETMNVIYRVPTKFSVAPTRDHFIRTVDATGQACFCLDVSGISEKYTCCSQYFKIPNGEDKVAITIKKDKNLYAIYHSILEVR